MATQPSESQGAPSTRSADSGSKQDELKRREYRDAQGRVHHHTRSYMQRHGGGSLRGGQRSSPEQARGEGRGRSEELSSPTTADAADLEETSDDLQIQVNTLAALAQMDWEAAAAYDTAAEGIDDPEVRAQLERFAEDHRRHISDLGRIIQELGGSVQGAVAPPPESSTFVMFAAALGALGIQGALLSLINSEQLTNANYELALELFDDPSHLDVIERNFADEQRHITWLTEQAREHGDVTDPTVEDA